MLVFFCLFASPFVQGLELHDVLAADAAKLHGEFPQLFAAPPSQADMDSAIRYLMNTGGYESVSFDRNNKGDFVIDAKPLRAIEAIHFTGVESFPKSKLLEILGLEIGEKFDRKKAVAAAEKLKAFYGESGYFNTIINLSFPKGQSQNVILQFEIQESAPCRVVSLDLKTENTVLKGRLYGRLARYIRKPLTDELLRALMRRANDYLIDHRYLTAELNGPEIRYNDDKSEAYLSYEIKNPYRWEFFFNGNTASTQLEIYEAMNWGDRERKNVDPPSEGAERIRRDYLAKGFPQVRVDTDVQTDNKEFLKKVFYDIHEGYHVKLKDLVIQGRISRTPKYYSDFILSNSSDLIESGYYNRQDLEVGFKNLVTELRNQGYLKARVQSSRIEYDTTKSEATVYVLMDEGPLTLVQSVSFDGNRAVSSFELTEVLGLNTGSALHLTDLETGIQRLKDFYHDQGFLEMRILNEGEDIVRYNENGTMAGLAFKLYEGPRVRVAAVRVEGNTFTKTRVILREVHFHTGEVLTPKKIEEAIIRLNRTGLFVRADIRTLEENSSVSERTVIVTVTERDPGSFRIGGGVTSERDLTARGFTQLAYNNLGGTGRAISARVNIQENIPHIHYPESDVTVSYLEPFVFGTLTRARVSWTRSEHVFDYETYAYNSSIPTAPSSTTSITLSNTITINLERDFNRHWRGTWKLWSLQLSEDFERNGHCITANAAGVIDYWDYCPADSLNVATMGPILDIDYRDSPFTPSRGSYTRVIGEYSDPAFGSSGPVKFVHLEAHESYYVPLKKDSNRWVWANEWQAGYLANLDSAPGAGVPVSNAFFLGGVDTVRGFDKSLDNERLPPQWAVPITEGNQILVKSDSEFYLWKTELRFPIVGQHGGVLFHDLGAVMISGYDIPRPWRDSVGFGYRYNTAVGAVSADLAFVIDPYTSPLERQAPVMFHFSIGSW